MTAPAEATTPLRFLRDKASVTRLLILAELERDPGATLSDVAVHLGVTVQAVSAYAKEMTAMGLLQEGVPGARVTPVGMQRLHEGVRHLRTAVDAVAAPLAVIRVTSAVAGTRIRKDERVGLLMQDGDLWAKSRLRASSTGRALHDAEAGDEVVVGDLTGLVELTPGHLHVVSVPSPTDGGIARVDVPRLRALLKDAPKPDKIGGVGTGAVLLARRLAGRVDFEFAAERAAFNACERGLDARLFVSRDRLADVMHAFDELNGGTLRRVSVEVLDAPEVAP